MVNNPLNVKNRLNRGLMESRSEIVKHYEAIAFAHGEYRSRLDELLMGVAPVVLAPAIDSLWNFDSTEADVFGPKNFDEGFLQSALSRSGLSANQVQESLQSTEIVMNNAVGSAFEIEVNEMFLAGELRVPPGTDSVRLLGRTHPGADFEFRNSSGDVIGLMNTKASSTYSAISDHFEKYPDVNYVYATHDATVVAAENGYTVVNGVDGAIPITDSPVVVDVGVDSTDYREAMREMVESDDGSFLAILNGDSIIDSVPWITLGILAYRTGRRHKDGLDIATNRKALFRDSLKSGSVYGVSSALQAAGIPIPVTMVASLFSAAAVKGVFRAKDEWGALAAFEKSLVTQAELMGSQGSPAS